MQTPAEICCPQHHLLLTETAPSGERTLVCANGCRFPIVKDIPRFVPSGGYATSFGRQWTQWKDTQLDSVSGLTLSHDRLQRCLGGDLGIVRGRTALEAGCGSGRFSEVLLQAGARLLSFDLSEAVDACHANIGDRPDHFCFQADIRNAPVQDKSFDFVLCLGVIQHTPSPEETIKALARLVKPGGMLVIDHYAPHDSKNYLSHRTHIRIAVRAIATRLPSAIAFRLIKGLCRVIIPLHRFLRPPNRFRGQGRLRSWLRQISPVMDYYETLPELGIRQVETWMTLDTHDALTDRYKHHRTVDEIIAALSSAGLVVEAAYYGGNGVEARGRRPVST